MNYSIKIVTFNVKPEVGNGFESKIMLFTKVGTGARDLKKKKLSQIGIREQSAFGTYRTFKLEGNKWCLLGSLCNLSLDFQQNAGIVSTHNNYFIITYPQRYEKIKLFL